MTRSQALAALRRALLPALLAAGLTFGLVLALLLTRPPTYEARVGVLATPVEGVEATDPSYGSVVSLTMPAVPEIALSSTVVDAVAAEVPAMDEDALTEAVAVELVPASGVARITVTAEDARTAAFVLQTVVDEVVTSGVLQPVATFRVVGSAYAAPVQVRPDPPLALGLGLLAAGVVGLLAVAAVQVLRPRLLTVDDVERVARSVVGAVPVVPLDRRGPGLEVVAARLAVAHPGLRRVVVVPAGPGAEDGLAEEVGARLDGSADGAAHGGRDHVPAGGSAAPDEPALVTVRLRRTSPDELTAALLAAGRGGRPVGLVLTR